MESGWQVSTTELSLREGQALHQLITKRGTCKERAWGTSRPGPLFRGAVASCVRLPTGCWKQQHLHTDRLVPPASPPLPLIHQHAERNSRPGRDEYWTQVWADIQESTWEDGLGPERRTRKQIPVEMVGRWTCPVSPPGARSQGALRDGVCLQRLPSKCGGQCFKVTTVSSPSP